MSREQTQNKIYFNANISLRQQRKSQFIAKTVQHWYFTTKCSKYPPFAKTQAWRRWRHCIVDDALVHVLPLLSDVLPQLIQNPHILSVDAFLEHAPYTIVYWI